ncbi:MAG: hypothetical protein QW507_01030 [Candidatus Nanoarchaeia archaeon]|nr:hypothetical protein [Candidatus Haiyanarchaeum thermophilum]MCW1303398.1 hypothetical protein [Candidatus Haiyanarchaeum thermophilum]MCW1303915.1 hypothetical protein [Candidatus Haiyanarchaeum thermophilum]MCW1306760.1 hypothetical protein [Candidatus Haiyanarchaeum thermophilum]MCW1307424.1 hypothetical protein [Candidatus Haiyanarchaeum thermophilum]
MRRRALALLLLLALVLVGIFLIYPSLTGLHVLRKTETLKVESLNDSLPFLLAEHFSDIFLLEDANVSLRGFASYIGATYLNSDQIEAEFFIYAHLLSREIPTSRFMFLKSKSIESLKPLFTNFQKDYVGGVEILKKENVTALLGENFLLVYAGENSLSLMEEAILSFKEGRSDILLYFPIFESYFLFPREILEYKRMLFFMERGFSAQSSLLLYSKSLEENASVMIMAGENSTIAPLLENLLKNATKLYQLDEMECYSTYLEGQSARVCTQPNLLVITTGEKEFMDKVVEFISK